MYKYKYRDKWFLFFAYVVDKKSGNEIAEICNCDISTPYIWLKKYNIPRRRKHTEEVKRKIADWNRGKTLSEATKRKISDRNRGRRFHHTEETKRKMSIGKKGIMIGDKHPSWKGDDAGYNAIHTWIAKIKPKPEVCELCGLPGKLELSNITGKLIRDINNFQYVHHRCHFKYDYKNRLPQHS